MPVFGRQAPASVAADVMGSASLNAMPSPSDPLQFPADALVKDYGRLLGLIYELKKRETDPMAQIELEKVERFFDSRISELVGSDEWKGAPASTPAAGMPPMGGMQPPVPSPAAGMPPFGGSPPAPGGIPPQ